MATWKMDRLTKLVGRVLWVVRTAKTPAPRLGRK